MMEPGTIEPVGAVPNEHGPGLIRMQLQPDSDQNLLTLANRPQRRTTRWSRPQKINTDRIAAQWDQICRLTTSLEAGTVTLSTIMRILQRGSNPSSLARALVELGRVIKTLHILTYCDDPIYRRDIQRILNRGESRNGLARDVAGSLPTANMPQTPVGGRLCDWQQPRW